ncbi:hypothetical protein BDP27DRAFT_1318957 [Rhodocollybia butyracea]|uniref:Uncharacterized protein n=1 Tax=Rhodocollybia butyracea TaxID=206335 RepID=A0A9P5Q3M6_9AGAR|nr:hypothetical protein BDP27DRAFT_1318957 [Rhodocollybia butyracea]
MVSERNENQQAEFAHGLRQRLGLPEPDADPAIAQNPALAQNARDVRSPLREISPPPSPTLLGSTHPHFDDEDQPRRRRVPNDLVSVQSTSNFNNPSSFFNDDRNANQGTMASHEMLRDALRLSPVPRSTLFDSDDENKDVDQETRHRLIKPIPARVRNSFTSTTGNGKASQAAESDYDGDDMFEDLPSSFFDDMDQVLSQSMQSMSTSASGVPLAGRSSGSFPVGTQAIIIEDNEEDDKENVAVQTRHVRPRIAQLNPNDVIELSDSD